MSMQIIASVNVSNATQMYTLTKSPERRKMTEVKNSIIEMESWVVYTGLDKNGSEIELMSIATKDGVFCTNSQTFIREFMDAYTMFNDMGEHFDKIKVIEGKSKANRPYLTCAVAESCAVAE